MWANELNVGGGGTYLRSKWQLIIALRKYHLLTFQIFLSKAILKKQIECHVLHSTVQVRTWKRRRMHRSPDSDFPQNSLSSLYMSSLESLLLLFQLLLISWRQFKCSYLIFSKAPIFLFLTIYHIFPSRGLPGILNSTCPHMNSSCHGVFSKPVSWIPCLGTDSHPNYES